MTFVKFDEILLIKFNKMRFSTSDEMSLVSSLMSRFLRVWWVVLVEHSSSRKNLESDNQNINDEMIKHDHENEFTEIFLQEKIWNRIFRSHFTFRDKTQQDKLLASSQQVAFLENQHFQLYQLLFTKRKKLSRREIAYNRHVFEKKKNKNFQNN
jgi:hypothetical protein